MKCRIRAKRDESDSVRNVNWAVTRQVQNISHSHMKKKMSKSINVSPYLSVGGRFVFVIGVIAYNTHTILIILILICHILCEMENVDSGGVLGLMNVLITVIITSPSAAFSCQFKSEQMNLIKVASAFY